MNQIKAGVSPTHAQQKYRPDIDGLRAIAVISVVAFHAFPAWITGGFIGVDIFFVISGYLISTIIYEGLESSGFNFVEFYARRIRRIFPSLLVVLTACFAFGWFVLLADEYEQLGKHIASGASFISNVILWSESSYFDNAADTKPLLHLWSLGIEEQFYLIWPLLVWAAWKAHIKILSITLVVAIFSFILNIYGINSNPVSTFYLPQNRFWELLSGSILAWFVFYRKSVINSALIKYQNFVSPLGFILIFVSLLSITKESSFPGWLALMPALGAVLIILSGSQSWLNRTVLANPLLVWIGLISFPLYLWHWPLLSFARIISSEVPTISVRVFALIVSVILAWLTYKLIEIPFRFGSHKRSKTIILVLLITAIGYVGYNAFQRGGLPFRKVVKINALKESGAAGGLNGIPTSECSLLDASGKKLFARCVIDNRENPKFALIGDSKALAIHEGLIRTSKPEGRWVFIGSGKEGVFVPVISNTAFDPRVFLSYTPAVIDFILTRDIEKVAIVSSTRMLFGYDSDKSLEAFPQNANYKLVLEGLYKTLEALTNAGKKVVLVIDNPTLLDPKDCLNRQTSLGFINKLIPKQNPSGCSISVTKHMEYSEQYRRLLFDLESKFEGKVKVFDTIKYMCNIKEDICMSSKDARLMYSYSDHISDYASGIIGADLNDFLLSY